ncbi:hypothetical protein HELRODRAFT_160277 [Helobdella robusta]|uniref:Uncharacterized protein n=1 Tax=Helobdella robusta TaxID=6412 RepID=T1EQ14_HELRO|nr:hypothetical protein HELRODRAFT_160277 [Helobdella robusta]ESO06129.1 hypothetical protein HELRODRAFT_160277 [Helobdella robusta]
MIRTKSQADAHVYSQLKQMKSKQERMLKGYSFAKIYHDIKEYKIAANHLLDFLSVKDNFAPAHKLLGQIYEATKADNAQILKAYKKSYDIDSTQTDILLKICELYSQMPADNDVKELELLLVGSSTWDMFLAV